MKPRIESISPMKVVGLHKSISLAANKTVEVWQQFMPIKNSLENRKNSQLISMSVYGSSTSDIFNPSYVFEKWAAVEVLTHLNIPNGLEAHTIQGGKYAVFIHCGPASEAPKTWNTIFGTWLPSSSYELDNREHFEILPEGYSPIDPNAKEEVWIPIKEK